MTTAATEPGADHGVPARGVLLVNLGTPDAPTPAALRKYLAEFLWDPRVIEMPRLPWWIILHGFILRFRPRRSARAYREIWTGEGSPLLVFSSRLRQAVQAALDAGDHGGFHVELGMRYGNPSIGAALEKLRERGAREVLVLPLYPQYSAATTASTFDGVADVLKTWRRLPGLRMVRSYYDDPGYLGAVAASIRDHWARRGRPDRLLFSFHGLPREYALAGDPYPDECRATARLVAHRLELDEDCWATAFQSRFGPREWLRPYTDKLLQQWARDGIGHAQVVCPGFSVDCLETLEEIEMQNRDFFLDAGGRTFSYIPALNDRPDHVQALRAIIKAHAPGVEVAPPPK